MTDGNATTALRADAIAQPNGGASLVGQVGNRREPKKDGGKIRAARSTKGHGNRKRRTYKKKTVAD